MCGIVAVYGYSQSAKRIESDTLETVRDAMAKRGPDGAGLWIDEKNNVGLGHRRLSIIDLTQTGKQPMVSLDGKIRIVFNGEIYNYQEIRQRLSAKGHTFISDSDTEVLLHLYKEKGVDLVHELRGMFAFAIWDDEKKTIFLARDPFGIKPLYFFDDGATFWCASQVKALLASGEIPTTIEPAGMVGFYLWGNVPEPFTLYKNLWALPAGHTLWIDREGVHTPQKYFSIADQITALEAKSYTNEEAQEILSNALRDSIKSHLVADVPVGVFLSSGLDSTVISAVASEFTQKLKAVTLGFQEYVGKAHDEVPLARAVAAQYGFEHFVEIVGISDFREEFETMLAAMDQPSIDGVNTYFVSRAAAQAGLKVVLSGLGGDEFFGSYPSFQQIPKLVKLARSTNAIPALGKTFRLVTVPLIKRWASPKYAGIFEYGGSYGGAYLLRRGLYMPWELPHFLDPDLVKEGWEKLQPVAQLDRMLEKLPTPHAKISALEMTLYMRNMLLRDADWAGMAHSLEIRVPFVDIEVFKSLAPLITAGSMPKKKEMAFVPLEKLPVQIIAKRKSGFSIPVQNWFAHFGKNSPQYGFRPWAKHIINNSLK